MKRNNLLLFSYIVFFFICLAVRSFTSYQSWDYVVASVAISSALLAYADFFYVHSKFHYDSCEMAEKFFIKSKQLIETEKSITEETCQKIVELKKMGIDVSQEERNFENCKSKLSEMEECALGVKNKATKNSKKYKYFSFLADILTFLAFLSCLCCITFTLFAEIIEMAQDIISVIAFIIILSSQYVSSMFSEKYRTETKQHDSAVETLIAAHEQVFETRNNFNIYYEKVKNYAN